MLEKLEILLTPQGNYWVQITDSYLFGLLKVKSTLGTLGHRSIFTYIKDAEIACENYFKKDTVVKTYDIKELHESIKR